MLSGRPSLRDPDGTHELEPHDVLFFARGPEGAHQVRNDSDEPVRVLMWSTIVLPTATVYPDSDKIGDLERRRPLRRRDRRALEQRRLLARRALTVAGSIPVDVRNPRAVTLLMGMPVQLYSSRASCAIATSACCGSRTRRARSAIASSRSRWRCSSSSSRAARPTSVSSSRRTCVPLIGFMLIGGVFADRLPRHLVVVSTDLVRFVLHALLAVLIVTGEVRIWHLVVIGVLFGSAGAFYRPAATGLLPQTVPEDEIQEATAGHDCERAHRGFAGPGAGDGARPRPRPGDRVRARRRDVPLQRGAARARASRANAARHREPATARATVRERPPRGLRRGRSRRWVWVTLSVFCVALFVARGADDRARADHRARTSTATSRCSATSWPRVGAGTIAGSLVGLRWRPRYPVRVGDAARAAVVRVGGAVRRRRAARIVLPCMAVAGARHRAVRHLVGHGAGGAHAAREAVARHVV